MGFARNHQAVMDVLPCAKECEKLPRDYIGNIIYTLVGEPFGAWVKKRSDARHAKKQAT